MTRAFRTSVAQIAYSTLSTKQNLTQMNSQKNSSTTCIACTKNQLIEIVHDPVNDYLREKWAFALNALDSVANDEYIYFDID